jgi:RecA/RadA recombinase
MQFDIESIRFRGEPSYAEILRKMPGVKTLAAKVCTDSAYIRRTLMACRQPLPESATANLYRMARALTRRFGIEAPVEIYKAVGAENTLLPFSVAPLLLEIREHLPALLDDDALAALLGREIGHYLAHGANNPYRLLSLAATLILQDNEAREERIVAAQRLAMSQAITADRLGLLACSDLNAALRLELASATGLSTDALAEETAVFLAQCKSLMETALAMTGPGNTHPEHSLRTWALWLFSETEVYQQLSGRGPGSRKLAELDAFLVQVLNKPGLDFGMPTLLEDSPDTAQAVALAVCVLTFCADGELRDAEIEAIERVFSPLTHNWRHCLAPEAALTEFQRLAPLVLPGGARLQRAIFFLVTHTLAMLGECSVCKAETLVAIGNALGCRKLFLELLPPCLIRFDLKLEDILARPERTIPMPPHKATADEALDIYLQDTLQRGGGTCSLRWLLQMLGARRAAPEHLERLTRLVNLHDLVIEPAPDQRLDALHRLTPLPGKTLPALLPPEAPPAGSGPNSERLRQALTRLRDRLILRDEHNPALRLLLCRPGRAIDLSELESVSSGLAEHTLTLLRDGKHARLFDAAEIETSEGAEQLAKSLSHLAREQMSRHEETGASDLYLGYPFVTGAAGGFLLRAPLILYPVSIERSARNGVFSLNIPVNRVPVANQSLLRLIFQRKGRPYPDELAEKADELAAAGPEALLGELALTSLGAAGERGHLLPFADRREELTGWRDERLEIEECAVLGLFPRSTTHLQQDYDALLEALNNGMPPENLLGSVWALLPQDLRAALSFYDMSFGRDMPTGTPVLPICAADPTQRAALETARAVPALVVEGPPGTGKSQTIVNLVADALARGEKVAVICEKRAALDVAAQRLEAAGLRHLLAVAHDLHADCPALYQQIVARLENAAPNAPVAPRNTATDEINRLMQRLNQRAALTRMTLPEHEQAGEDVPAMTLGELHTYAAGFDVPLPCLDERLHTLTPARMNMLAMQIASMFPQASLWREGSIWRAPASMPNAARVSFAHFDNEKANAFLKYLITARSTAKTLEEALTVAGLSADKSGYVALKAAKNGLLAAFHFRKQLESKAGQATLAALLDEDARLELIERTQPVWRALADSRARRQENALGNHWFAELIATLAVQPEGEEALKKLVRLWQKHDAILDAFPQPFEFLLDQTVLQALSQLRANAGSALRFLSPACWQAQKTVHAWLALHWPEKASATIDVAFLDHLDEKAAAARCWQGLSNMLHWLNPQRADTPNTLGEARAWMRAATALIEPALILIRHQEDLQTMGFWRGTPTAEVIAGWDEKANYWIDCHHSAQTLRAVFDTLKKEESALQALNAFPEGWDIDTLTAWNQRVEPLVNAISSMSKLAAAINPVHTALPWLPKLPSTQLLDSLIAAWRRDAAQLLSTDRHLAKAQAIAPQAQVFLAPLADGAAFDTPESWADGVRKTWAKSALAAIEKFSNLSALDQASGEKIGADEARLAVLYKEEQRFALARILARQSEAPLLRTPPAEKGAHHRTTEQIARAALLNEAKKLRHSLPLRGFARRFWDKGLMDVLPAWLLAPEVVPLLFPRAPIFDLIIVDEASQCAVESSLSALMRARRVVIVGDERQMPPNNAFFRATTDGGEAPNVERKKGEDDLFAAREIFDAESLLTLARHRALRVELSWHYRCRREELIAFSNHVIYENGLKTIPAAPGRRAKSAIRWISVPNGRYEAGANIPEAYVVVNLLAQLLQAPGKPSLGVVTFNPVQRRAILDEIDRRLEADPLFAEHWQQAAALPRLDERPFVKNLETVQGDERDIILFSTGFAPVERILRNGQKQSRLPAYFGVLGQAGGERRLNVAITRAKKEMFVVASFDPRQLSVARSKHDGPRRFKEFLLFAQRISEGRRDQAAQILGVAGKAPLDRSLPKTAARPAAWLPLNVQLALALEDLGIQCEMDVGISGFRVPLAILDAEHPGRYLLGLLFDETLTDNDGFERHVQIPSALASRGWKFKRVSSREWDKQRPQVLMEIRAALEAARRATDSGETSVVELDMQTLFAEPVIVKKPKVAKPPRKPALVAPATPATGAAPTAAATPEVEDSAVSATEASAAVIPAAPVTEAATAETPVTEARPTATATPGAEDSAVSATEASAAVIPTAPVAEAATTETPATEARPTAAATPDVEDSAVSATEASAAVIPAAPVTEAATTEAPATEARPTAAATPEAEDAAGVAPVSGGLEALTAELAAQKRRAEFLRFQEKMKHIRTQNAKGRKGKIT